MPHHPATAPGRRALAFAAALSAAPAAAQPAAELPALEVTGRRPDALTAPGVEAQRRALEETPAAVRLVDGRDLADRYALTLRDVLADTPGVFARNRFGQEVRLSVRGSGIARGAHLRGVELLQDGVPVNLADGSGDFYQIDPLAARSVAVHPGGNGLRFGASALGGAIDFVTATARTAEAPGVLRAEGGSYGTWRLSGQVSRAFGDWDALATATAAHSDGYRRHSRSQYELFNANVGHRIAPNLETRFYAGAYVTRQLSPGALTLSGALDRPRDASAAAVLGNWARNVWAERFANRTTADLGSGRLDLDSWIVHRRLHHPVFQVLDQDALTWGVAPRFATAFDAAGLRGELVVGARYFAGADEARQYVSLRGSRGRRTLDTRRQARNYEAFAEGRLWVLPEVALVAGAKAFRNERDYEDKGGGLPSSRGAVSLGRTYDGFAPRVGALWRPRPEVQLFANLTRSADVPDFADLTQTQAGGATGFVPLAAQRAWTAEVGTRGRFERHGWDLTLFRSNVRGQLLQFTPDPNGGVPAGAFNAGLTVNHGVEFAGRAELARDLAGAGDRLTLNQVWTFNDFRLRGDRQYGDNRIAGLPPHVLRTTLTYARPEEGLSVSPVFEWVPQGAWADYANTMRANAYLTLGLQAGLAVAPGVSVFLDARNLTGKRYISDVVTITDARRVGSAVFYPGEGRSVYVGARAAF